MNGESKRINLYIQAKIQNNRGHNEHSSHFSHIISIFENLNTVTSLSLPGQASPRASCDVYEPQKRQADNNRETRNDMCE
jgi:hypothetical protein